MTWSEAGGGLGDEAASPILIDPQAHNLLFVMTQGVRGGGDLYRTSASQWERIPNAPIGTPLSDGSGLGLALDGGARGLYVGSTNGTLYVSHNAYTPNLADITWQPVHTFVPAARPIPLAVGYAPGGSALYVSLFSWGSDGGSGWKMYGRTMRSDDGGATWTPITIPPPVWPAFDCHTDPDCDRLADSDTHPDFERHAFPDADHHPEPLHPDRSLAA